MVLKMLERANTHVFNLTELTKEFFFIYKEGESALYVRDGDSSKSRTRFKILGKTCACLYLWAANNLAYESMYTMYTHMIWCNIIRAYSYSLNRFFALYVYCIFNVYTNVRMYVCKSYRKCDETSCNVQARVIYSLYLCCLCMPGSTAENILHPIHILLECVCCSWRGRSFYMF